MELFYVEGGGDPWALSGLVGHDGSTTRYSSTVGKTATWTTPNLPLGGQYDVEVWYPNHSNATTQADYTISHAGGQAVVSLNQKSTGGSWIALGTWTFNAGASATVELEVATTNGGATRADAVRFRYAGGIAPVEIVMDNGDSSGVTIAGNWTNSTWDSGYYGSNYMHDQNSGKGSKSVTFTPTIPKTAIYTVYVRWVGSGSNNRATNTPIDINHAGGTNTSNVNQNQNSGTWVSFGDFQFNAGTSGSVVIRNDGTSGYVIADGVRLVEVTP